MPPPLHASAPLVGRTAELAELDTALSVAVVERTAVAVTVVAGAGMGKRRLLDEFAVRVDRRERRARILRVSATPGGPAFGIVQKLLRARFGLSESGDPEVARQTFRTAVADALGDPRVTEFLHFLGGFLDLKFPESALIRAVEEDPEELSRVSRAVLRRFLEVDAGHGPLVLFFEDLEWAPDDSLALLEYLIGALRNAPLLIVSTARPEFLARRPEWLAAGRHRRLDLAPLDGEHATRLLGELLAPAGPLPPALVENAVDTAGGSPFLLEQMARAFLESGAVVARSDGPWEIHLERLDQTSLPLTVDDAIDARIAALAPAERELLELAAVTGSLFWAGALLVMKREGAKPPELWGGQDTMIDHIRDQLVRLAERDYVLAMPDSSLTGEVEYAFKHNLERERLQRLVPPERAKSLHMRVAEWLEFRLGERNEEQLELLAQHYEAGGAPVRAGRYFLRAGDAARARYANVKAAEYYARGLALVGDRDVRACLTALHHYGDVLQLAGKNEEALGAFRGMLDLAYRLDLRSKGGAAHNRIGRLFRAIGHLEEAMRHLGTGHALFDAAGDQRGVASSLDDVGKVHWMRGNYAAAERFMKQALELRRELADPRSIALSYNNLGIVYQDSGRFNEALEAFDDALAQRREIDDRPGIAQTLNNLGTVYQDAGDHAAAVERYTEAFEVAREVGDWMRQAVILTNLGESKYRMNQPGEAVRVLEQAADISATLGDRILAGEVLRGLAKAHLILGNRALAKSHIDASVREFEAARGKPFLGVALRTEGEIYGSPVASREEHDLARRAFEQSVALFEELGNVIELAQSCQAFAGYLEQFGTTRAEKDQAAALRTRAELVRDRVRDTEVDLGDEPTAEVGMDGRPTRGHRR